MTPKVAKITRHPIKSHGREQLQSVDLTKGSTMPWDRVWAVAHEAAHLKGKSWVPCANFSRGAKAPSLMAISARFDEKTEIITLRHPDLPEISLHPERDAQRLLDWVSPLMPENRAQSTCVVRPDERGMTDTDYPSVSIGSLSSLAALETKMGVPLAPDRFRMNFWVDGLTPWEEFSWVGKSVKIGTAVLAVRERTTRCKATTVNNETGRVDADTLAALEDGWGHRDFGVYAEVVECGQIQTQDTIELTS